MNITIEQGSGFCFGVERAIEMAEEALERGEKVFCLGQIVHNEMEVERLHKLGMITINKEEFKELRNARVLVRAHGEPPETYAQARKNNLQILDASCPIVLRLQSHIRQCWEKYRDGSGQVVIFGKKGHAEVIGLQGQTNGQAILLENREDLHKVDFSKPLCLFSQTTRSMEKYREIIEGMKEAYRQNGLEPDEQLMQVHQTICGQVSNREPRLRNFARKMDLIIFVSGSNSSNGKMLFKACKEEKTNSYRVSSSRELQAAWFQGQENIGICGATSTPKWLMEEVSHFISENFTQD